MYLIITATYIAKAGRELSWNILCWSRITPLRLKSETIFEHIHSSKRISDNFVKLEEYRFIWSLKNTLMTFTKPFKNTCRGSQVWGCGQHVQMDMTVVIIIIIIIIVIINILLILLLLLLIYYYYYYYYYY